MNRVAYIDGSMVVVVEVPTIDLRHPEQVHENAYGVPTVDVVQARGKYRVENMMETAYIDWSTVDYLFNKRA